MRKYYYLLSVLFVSVGTVVSAPSQAQNTNHDYLQAWNLAMSATNSCYTNKNLEECDKLTQIKSTLMTWCQQSNDIKSDACITYKNVTSYESLAQTAELVNQLGNIP